MVATLVEVVGSIRMVATLVEDVGSIRLVATLVEVVGSIRLVATLVEVVGSIRMVATLVEDVGSIRLVATLVEVVGSIRLVATLVEVVGSIRMVATLVEVVGSIRFVATLVEVVGSIRLVATLVEVVVSIRMVATLVLLVQAWSMAHSYYRRCSSGLGVRGGTQETEEPRDRIPLRIVRAELGLSSAERAFLASVQSGDAGAVRTALGEARRHRLDMRCADPLGRGALVLAIDLNHLEVLEELLRHGLPALEALLHAVRQEALAAVQLLLKHLPLGARTEQVPTYRGDAQFNECAPDATPIILAAHTNNYELIKLLVERGASVPRPHAVRCGCTQCVRGSEQDGLMLSRSRLSVYRALASPCLIALASEDPFLTAFTLSCELWDLSCVENEFKSEYEELSQQCKRFAKELLDQTQSSQELEIILNFSDDSTAVQEPPEALHLARLKLAIKYHQKEVGELSHIVD
uniref:short transient receptor potential channel 4-like n=1 Tax=Myxine glutinosa TaxID=7769 RepID=UPI00358FEB1F